MIGKLALYIFDSLVKFAELKDAPAFIRLPIYVKEYIESQESMDQPKIFGLAKKIYTDKILSEISEKDDKYKDVFFSEAEKYKLKQTKAPELKEKRYTNEEKMAVSGINDEKFVNWYLNQLLANRKDPEYHFYLKNAKNIFNEYINFDDTIKSNINNYNIKQIYKELEDELQPSINEQEPINEEHIKRINDVVAAASLSAPNDLLGQYLKIELLKLYTTNKLKFEEIINDLGQVFEFYHECKDVDGKKVFVKDGKETIIDLSSITIEQFLSLIKKSKKKDYITNKLDASNIVYSDWNNEEYKGYFILELKTKDELVFESSVLKHCVGDSDHYIDKIKEGTSRIFSLRNSSNIPQITIEADPSLFKFYQTFGANNKSAEGIYLDMINEWKKSLHSESEILTLVRSENINDRISAANFLNYNDSKQKEIIDYLIETENDSGKENIGNAVSNQYLDVLQALAANNSIPSVWLKRIFKKSQNNKSTIFHIASNKNIDNILAEMILHNPIRHNMSVKALCANISIKNLPSVYQSEEIIQTIELRMCLLNNTSLPSKISKEIIASNFDEMLMFDCADHICEPKLIDDLYNLTKDKFPEKLKQVTKIVLNTDSKVKKENILDILNSFGIKKIKDNNEDVTAQDVKFRLAEKNNTEYLELNIFDPNFISTDQYNAFSPIQQSLVINNPELEFSIKLTLADEDFLRTVWNKVDSRDIIELYKREGYFLNILRNNNASPDIIHKIYELIKNAQDRLAYFEEIAKNKNTPQSVLKEIFTTCESLSSSALETDRMEIAVNPTAMEYINSSLSRNGNFPKEDLSELLSIDSKTPRRRGPGGQQKIFINAIQYQNITFEEYKKLDPNSNLIGLYMKNPNCPQDIMFTDPYNAIFNKECPTEILTKISEDLLGTISYNGHIPHDDVVVNYEDEAAEDDTKFHSVICANHKNTPTEYKRKLIEKNLLGQKSLTYETMKTISEVFNKQEIEYIYRKTKNDQLLAWCYDKIKKPDIKTLANIINKFFKITTLPN